MSFDYMKNLSIDFKKGKIKMTVYANNVIPYHYCKWEFDEKNNEKGRTLRQEINYLASDLVDGNLHPVNSSNNYKLWYIKKRLLESEAEKEYCKWRWNWDKDETIEKAPDRQEKIEYYREQMGEIFIKLWNEKHNESYYLIDNDKDEFEIVGAKVRETRNGKTFRKVYPEPKGFYETEFILNIINGTEWNSGKYNYGKVSEKDLIEASKYYPKAKEIYDKYFNKSGEQHTSEEWSKIYKETYYMIPEEDKTFIKSLITYKDNTEYSLDVVKKNVPDYDIEKARINSEYHDLRRALWKMQDKYGYGIIRKYYEKQYEKEVA